MATKTQRESAPYTAGELLCELLEAIEALENHVLFGKFDDTAVVVGVFANLGARIRKQAIEEELVSPLQDGDPTAGRLTIGAALKKADKVVYTSITESRKAARETVKFVREPAARGALP